MAISITKIDVATPTNPSATSQAGGSLDAGITYYYRIIALRAYNNTLITSTPSTEVSATTDATNKSILLSWDTVTDAWGYIMQRTTTSGSYPPDGNNTWGVTNWYGYAPKAMLDTSFVDGSTGSLAYSWLMDNMDFTVEHPTIDISSDADDSITMKDVWEEDDTNSWGLVKMLVSDGLDGYNNANFRKNAPYFIKANIRIHDCQFYLPELLYVWGSFQTESTVTLTTRGFTNLLTTAGPHAIVGLDNTVAYVSGRYNKSKLTVDSSSVVTDMVNRTIRAGIGLRVYDQVAQLHGGISNGTFTRFIGGRGAGNYFPISGVTGSGVITETGMGVSGTSTITDPIIRGSTSNEGISLRGQTNGWVVRPTREQHNGNADITIGHSRGNLVIDGVFKSNGQTDNIPYIRTIVPYIGYTLLVAFTLKLTVIDTNGSSIEGVTVAIADANGNSAIWQNTGCYLYESMSDGETTSVDVSDGSLLSVGDYLRSRNYQEIFKVTAINGNTIDVDRAQQGTREQYIYSSTFYKQPLLKQIANLTTDADGVVEPDYELIGVEVEITSTSRAGPYKVNDASASNYWNANYHTPHTVTISKTGYKTRVVKYTMDRRREEVEKLSPDGTDITNATLYGSNIY